ncbi:RES family NAD+ phosphorylase [Dietzia cinnamea]|uniref:RES family NAD+ phosphorylase n=1 Tax=Dietzia cinnamea TaxID=321318 RepID=UPI00223AC2D2|nr:RES family NAD+ phosphorylase [Dietzia cinnamea]MCT2300220.1 RES family NAD+ phosphorylase [Dietzia cinnamea]
MEWDDTDIVTVNPGTALWRIHRTGGPFPSAWSDYRFYGPLPGMRWDPHPAPTAAHTDCAVLYTAYDLPTCIAEVSHPAGLVDTVTASPFATSWSPTRPLRLLDLTRQWPLRMDATHALMFAPRSTCRNWAHEIWKTARSEGKQLDGLEVQSTVTGSNMAVLFSDSQNALPAAPAFTSPLSGPMVFTIAANLAARVQWPII